MSARTARYPILLAALLTVGQALVSMAATPLAPTNLTATATSETTIVLSWTDNSTNENSFKIELSTNAVTGFVQIAKTRANVTSYTSTGLAPATAYYFRVYAFRKSNPQSAYTNVASATTLGRDSAPPTMPSGLATSPMSCSRIDLTWSPSTDSGTGVAGYQIYRGGSVIGTTTSTSFSNTGLPGSTSFTYNVAAYDVAGNFSAMSASAAASTTSCTTNQAPTAAAGPDRTTPTLASLVFDGSGSHDADGSISSYSWNFGDGGTGTGASVSHLFGHAGTYNVVLTVADNMGATASDTAVVTVTNRAPSANAGADQTGTTGTALSFSGSGSNDSDGSIVSYSWSFGDGATGTGMSASHVYANAGTFTVTLTTMDDMGSQGSDTAMASISAAVTVPASPSGLSASAVSSSRVNLTWTDNSSNESGFVVERAASASGPFSQIGTPTSASFSDMSAPVAAMSYYRVSATNSAGTSAPSNVASTTTPDNLPAAPASLTATAMSASQINLSWSDSSSNETGFKIERASASTGPWSQIMATGAGVTSWSNTGLSASTTLFYRVKASGTAGDSAPSPMASATTQAAAPVLPAAPSSLTANATSSTQIVLGWIDNASNETGFKIERGASVSGPFTQIGTTGAGATSFTDTGLTASTAYSYRVRATSADGDSSYSNTASATTQAAAPVLPAAPSSLTANATSSTQIVLGWIDNASNETGFKIERGASVSGPFTQIGTTGAGATSFTDTGLTASTAYSYRVRATSADGDSSYSNTASATTQAAAPVLPAAPSSLTANATSSTQIVLGWIDNASNETGFKIERGASVSGPFTQIGTTGAGATSFTDTGLTASTAYSYRVRATSAAGDSGYSNTASATTQAGASDTSAPTVPASIVTTAPVCGGIQIAWGASTDTGTSGLAGYKVYRKSAFVGQVSASTTSFLDTGLPSAAYYYYYVSAIDNAGNESAKSAAIGTYTLSCTGAGGAYDWDRHSGGDIFPDDGMAAATDASGNTFVAGDFSATTTFGSSSLVSAGSRDAFVTKYREDGSIVWAKRFGGAYDDFAEGIAVDASGNVYVTGKFQGSADLGGGLTSAGGYDIFLAKLSGSTGQVVWAKRIGGTGADEGTSLALDGNGNVFVTGQFFGTVDFGGGAVTNASSYVQVFIAKYSTADGSHVWSRRLGKLLATAPTTVGSGRGISVDPSGNPVISGYFGGPVDFGGGALTNAGGMDLFVAKYAGADGRYMWAKRFGDATDQHATSVATDSSGDVVITGDFLGSLDFGTGALPQSSGTQTIFLAKLASADGSTQWARSFVAAGLNVGSYGWAVATDGANNIVMTGQMSGPVDLGGGALSNVGGVFAAKYDSTGAHVWSKNFRGGGGQGRGVAIGAGDEIIITGAFDTVQDFGGGDVRSGGNVGTDLFVLCLGR